MTPSSAWRLYVILDRAALGARDLTDVAAAAIRGGADVLQLRDKTASTPSLINDARRLLPLTRHAGIPLIINDCIEAVRSVNADGVHLGQEDRPIQEARAILGPGALIGQSTHSLEQARAAQRAGADYIGLGPIFPTPTKPTYDSVGTALIRQVVTAVSLPVVCIGGIDERTVDDVVRAGAPCVAVVRAVCGASNPEGAARMLKRCLVQYHRAPT